MPYDMRCNQADKGCGNCQHARPHEKADDCALDKCSRTTRKAECVKIETELPEPTMEAKAFLAFLLERKKAIIANKITEREEYNLGTELKRAWDAGREYERGFHATI